MKYKLRLAEELISFCVCTTCITLLQGLYGMLFYPDMRLDYSAFFMAPMFGVMSVLLGVVTWSKKELSVKQVLVRRALHLLLIEGMVFGVNYAAGVRLLPEVCIALAFGIAVVFVTVYVILWINERNSAKLFNQKLKEYQASKL